MGIVEYEKPRQFRRISRFEGIASGALIAAAVFAASPKPAHGIIDYYYTGTGGTTTDPNNVQAVSWFNTANWSQGVGATGTLPESFAANSAPADIEANNTSM